LSHSQLTTEVWYTIPRHYVTPPWAKRLNKTPPTVSQQLSYSYQCTHHQFQFSTYYRSFRGRVFPVNHCIGIDNQTKRHILCEYWELGPLKISKMHEVPNMRYFFLFSGNLLESNCCSRFAVYHYHPVVALQW